MAFEASEEDLRLFLDEADELLQVMEEKILALERGAQGPEVVQELFRAAHTLKGSSATLGHQPMAEVTHAMENLLDPIRRGTAAVTGEVTDTLLACLDVLRQFREGLAEGRVEAAGTAEVLRRLERALWGAARPAPAGGEAGAAEAGGGEAGRLPALAPGEQERLERAVLQGRTPWRVELRAAPGAPMPSVRFFQALLALRELGEVIRSWPSQEEIEQDRAGETLVALVVADRPEAALRAALAAVPETELVGVAALWAAGSPREPGGGREGGAAPAGPAAGGRGLRPNGARTVRVDVDVLDSLMNLVGELVIDRTRLVQVLTTMDRDRQDDERLRELLGAAGHIGRVTGDLQELIMRARMLPVESLFRKFPRMVRDLARAAQKEIEFVVRGEETELDRSVIEEIGDPLMHILRNAVDHGIEPPMERLRAGKPAAGTITLEARHEENHIVITVRDDGRGIDPDRVRAAAVRKGFLSEEAARRLPDEEAVRLIFAPGFSTAEQVTEVSGRGVGLDAAHKNIERLNGTLDVRSERGKGTEFRIQLPLTLAIIRALLVEHRGTVYAVPLGAVTETIRVAPGDVRTVQGREVVVNRGVVVPILRLERAFELEAGASREGGAFLVIVNLLGRSVGVLVDRLVGEEDVVVKSLGQYVGEVPGISGATLLGDGSVALILDVARLANTEMQRGQRPA